LVADDVHHLGDEQVKLRPTADHQTPPTPPGLVLRAVAVTAPAQRGAVLDAAVSRR
jgi:hypothetical protein